MNNNGYKFKPGDIVYIINYDNIYKCEIECFYRNNENQILGYRVHNLDIYGCQGSLAENTFATKKEAEQELLNRSKQKYNHYQNTIKTKEDLLNRMYQEISMQEFPNYELAQVIREKTKELFNIDLITEY